MKIQQLETELTNLRKLNASKCEINKRAPTNNKSTSESKLAELDDTVKDLKDQIKKIKSENLEMAKLISRKQTTCQESEKKLLNLKKSMFQEETKQKEEKKASELEKMQAEYESLCQKKKQLLELKNSKEADHKVLKDNLAEYLKNLQQKFLGFLSTGNL